MICPKRKCSETTFGLEAKNYHEALEKKNCYISDKLDAVQQILEDEGTIYIDPTTGRKIENATNEKLWFANNVCIYFSIGKIFNSTDKEFLDNILEYFDKIDKNIFLLNEIKTTNYLNEITKLLEKQVHIDNGNYHIMFFVIVYAPEEELKDAPEHIFSTRGLVDYSAEMSIIRNTIMGYMEKYGLTIMNNSESREFSRVSEYRDDKTLLDTKFKFTSNVDYDSPENRELFSNIFNSRIKDNDFAVRQRMQNDARACKVPKTYNKQRNNDSLHKRIRNETAFNNLPTNKKGAYDKQKDYITPSMTKKDEFQLFDCDYVNEDGEKHNDSYMKYKNKTGQEVYVNSLGLNGIGCRDKMQIASIHAPKQAGRDASASMLSGHACMIKDQLRNINNRKC